MNKSIWDQYLNEKDFPALTEDIKTDVLVIGGGITGLLIAKKLKDNNINTILVEKDKIGNKTTSKTTAFITLQHETLYQDLSYEKRKEYLNLNDNALKEYLKMSKEYDIDFEFVDSCLFSKDKNIIEKEYNTLISLNQDVFVNQEIPFNNDAYGIYFKNQGIINPIKLVNLLSNEINIFENTEITKLKSNYAITKNNKKIFFNKVVIATHYPINNKLNLLFMKLTQRKSYVVALKKNKVNGTYCSIDSKGFYYRMYQEYLIIGGNDRDTGCKCISDFNKIIIEKYNLKEEDILYSWYGQDCITLDGIPYIGYSDIFHKNHIIVTGFNLWGFTWAMASSNIVLNIIKNVEYCHLTKLNRFFINKNLFKNIKNSFVNLVNFNKPRCSHLGCRLIYNKNEKIYECPCHGSVFNKDKKVIEGPAKKDLN